MLHNKPVSVLNGKCVETAEHASQYPKWYIHIRCRIDSQYPEWHVCIAVEHSSQYPE